MSIIQAAVRPRSGLQGPIRVVFGAGVGIQTTNAQWGVDLPDPGLLQAGDVAVAFVSTLSGSTDSPTPQTNGWTFLGGNYQDNGSGRSYYAEGYALRVTSSRSLTLDERRFFFFTNFINSATHAAIVVLRGMQNSGFLGQDFALFRAYSTLSFPDPPAFVPASPVSSPRSGANRLALSFGHTLSGTLGSAPAGWTNVFQQAVGEGHVYCEAQWFAADGTTTQVARSPSPQGRGYGLIHAIAP